MNRESLRKEILSKRLELSKSQCESLSVSVFQQFLLTECELVSPEIKKVGLYSPIKNEVLTSLFFNHFIDLGIECFFPKVVSNTEIQFGRVTDLSELEIGRFGILEPKKVGGDLDLLLVPAIAFSRAGYRLGYGQGYYDRYCEKKKDLISIGLAYSFQVVDGFPTEKHDVKLNHLVTNHEVLSF
ncbi:MAG: 5-formyltetrahydrofolate cyclo-ligase [Bacteriovoracia bacterium]